ncbi:hypothetical protein Avbf_12540 [Armadillidium vulgare]|nr:hypothetical protein Avbf_12540 [Armadillidium vulgare]
MKLNFHIVQLLCWVCTSTRKVLFELLRRILSREFH